MDPPLLHAGDLTLRPTDASDEAGIALAGRDPTIRRLPWFGAGFEDSWAEPWVRRAMDEWRAGRNRTFSILDAEGSYCGTVNVGPLKDGAVEVAYWVLPACRGRGVASAALSAVLAWARETFPAARIWAKTALDNAASQRVLLKCRFSERGRRELAYFDWTG
jgi:RimJ/RimL family protein N-acetyltransferase